MFLCKVEELNLILRCIFLGLVEYIVNDSSNNSYLYINLQKAFTYIMQCIYVFSYVHFEVDKPGFYYYKADKKQAQRGYMI